MDRGRAVIHVDTHVLVWIAAGELHRLPARLVRQLSRLTVYVSPMVVLELQYLHEIGRIAEPATSVVEYVRARIDLRVAESSFSRIAHRALDQSWTRDPFDRLIAAGALADDLPLLTADARLRENCAVAQWEEWA